MRAYVEGYGCSLNKSDTEQVQGFLLANGFSLAKEPKNAQLIVINTCAVKEQTEAKMLKRIRELSQVASRHKSTLIVFGCLPKINPKPVSSISKGITQIGPSLEQLAAFLELPPQCFSPAVEEKRSSEAVSIIPIARGCRGQCSYCAVRSARGQLKSYGIAELNKKFKRAIKEMPEIWLTAQDCACYGYDLGTNLPRLLKTLLRNKGNFRIRIGMINPLHIAEFLPEYLALFEDRRLFRFFHIPVQSGSNKILKAMDRRYSRQDFLKIAKAIRSLYPDATISTDAIAGFPGETEADFQETVSLLREAEPDIVNISRFGARPNTLAAKMPGQLHGRVKKARSRALTKLCKEIALRRNNRLLSAIKEILVDEKGKKGTFVGRTQEYKPVALKKAKLGSFAKVKINKALPGYLLGEAAK